MPRKPREPRSRPKEPKVESAPYLFKSFPGPDGKDQLFGFHYDTPFILNPPRQEVEPIIGPRLLPPEFATHWTSALADPRNLKLGDLRQLQSDIEQCCKNLGCDPARYTSVSAQTDVGRLLYWLCHILERAHGYPEFLKVVDEVLKDRFSAAAVERAILLLGKRPGLSPRKVEALSIAESVAMLRQSTGDGAGQIIRANAERNEWLFDQYCNHPEKTIAAIRREAKQKGWHLGSDMTLRAAIKSHCKASGIDPPTRKTPRIKQD
jgi:hypothetical protein